MTESTVVLLAIVGLAFGLRSLRRIMRASSNARSAERDLVLLALGDREKVERLIEFERERDPTASRARLLRRATNRWRASIR